MRYINSIYQKLRFASLLLLCIIITVPTFGQEEKEKKNRQMIDITLKVTDESGTPVQNANVTVGEGVIHAVTDANGAITFKAFPEDFVAISSSAYEQVGVKAIDLLKDGTVKLVKSKLYMTANDNVALPFATVKKRNNTGTTTTIDGNRLEMYPSTDIRNALTGLAPGMEVREYSGQPGVSTQENMGAFGASFKLNISSRGQSMIYIIDNVPIDITEMPLDPNEIESVTIVKDIASKAMFGPVATDGVVLITTKRGKANDRNTTFNFESGVNVIDRMPEFVTDGGQYATLNNQARLNDKLTANYDQADIDAYSKNDPWDLYHPSVNFKDMMLKNTAMVTRANVTSSGGSDAIQYYAYLGYNGEGDIYKIGATSDYNRVTTRSNIDIKVNDFIKIKFDFYGNLSYRRSPNYGYSSNFTDEANTSLNLIEMPSVLTDINSIPPIAFPVYAAYDDAAKVPWYGVSTAYGTNPVGGLEGNGYYTENGRMGAANIALDFDLGNVTKGLKLTSFLDFNIYNLTRIGKAEDYIAYKATPSVSTKTGADTILLSRAHLGFDAAANAKLMDYYFQRFAIYENLSYDRTFGKSNISSSLTYYLSKVFKNGIEEPERQQNGIFTSTYTFDDKYSVFGVLNYAGTYSFAEDERYALYPSGGVSWVISDEGFMSGLGFLNFLKLRAQGGIMGVENFLSPFYYIDRWNINTSGGAFGPHSSSQWFGSNTETNIPRSNIQRVGNPDLTWETSTEFSAGFDALFFKEKLSFELTYYNNVRDGQIIQVLNELPLLAGVSSSRPWINYNKTKYFGLETGLQFTDRKGDLLYSIGANATIQNSERLIYDEPNYRGDYQNRTGKPTDAYFGQKYLGKFETDAETQIIPQRFDDQLYAGDLKYQDMNGDGIVDDNDASQIGHTAPRLYYSINARVAYKRFDLTLIGTGRAFYDIPLTSSYYWNGWGDNTYSAFTRDNIGGAYPRLTYYRVNNNFVGSDFWLTNGGYFKLQNVEIGYNLPTSVSQSIGGRLIRFYLRGANLLTISEIKEIDPEAPYSGITNYPLMITFTAGVKLNF